jgi:ankyrin repeat domain-containing protein 50
VASMELVSKQLVLSGRLKPEARLGLAISELAQSLNSDRRNEFRSMQTKQDAQISGLDIIKMTEEINQEGPRRHRCWRQHATKVSGFLSGIQTFATIGDVLDGGSRNLIATGV